MMLLRRLGRSIRPTAASVRPFSSPTAAARPCRSPTAAALRSFSSSSLVTRQTPRFRRREQQQLEDLEGLVRQLQKSVDRNHHDIVSASSWAKRIWSETRGALNVGVARIQEAMPLLRFITNAPRFAAGVIGSILVGGYVARSYIYHKVVDESEKLGREVLERNVRNVISTLDGVAKDPETLALLVVLLQQLLEDETTRSNLNGLVLGLLQAPSIQSALLKLLVQLFEDPRLQHTAGVFALDALNTPEARKMLDAQLARLVSATVLDAQVQADTGRGIRTSIGQALFPWRRPGSPPIEGVVS